MTTEVDEFLAHYGVPGMKWGKRKAASVKTDISNRVSSSEIAKKWNGLSEGNKKKVKTIAAISGSAALVAGSAFVGSRVNKNMKMKELEKYAEKLHTKEVYESLRTIRNNATKARNFDAAWESYVGWEKAVRTNKGSNQFLGDAIRNYANVTDAIYRDR